MNMAISASRSKFALIAILAAVFGAVMLWPSAKKDAEPSSTSADRLSRRKAKTAATAKPPHAGWSAIPRNAVQEFNPFAVSKPALITSTNNGNDQPPNVSLVAKSGGTSTADAPKQQQIIQVQAILDRGGKRMALVDGQPVEVGDILPARGRVASIGEAEVLLEAVE